MLSLNRLSSTFHQRDPPNNANATIAVLAAMAVRAFQRLRVSGCSPGGRELSRTAAPTIVTRPTNRKIPTAASGTPNFGSSPRRPLATTTTGITALPAPRAPFTLTVTLLDPPDMIQSGAE